MNFGATESVALGVIVVLVVGLLGAIVDRRRGHRGPVVPRVDQRRNGAIVRYHIDVQDSHSG